MRGTMNMNKTKVQITKHKAQNIDHASALGFDGSRTFRSDILREDDGSHDGWIDLLDKILGDER